MAPRRKKEEEPDPEQMRRDMERLALIRKKRCDSRCSLLCALAHGSKHCASTRLLAGFMPLCREEDRLKRIAEEGFDRYAPPADGNQRWVLELMGAVLCCTRATPVLCACARATMLWWVTGVAAAVLSARAARSPRTTPR